MSNGLLMKSFSSSLWAGGQVIGIVVHFICWKYYLQFKNIEYRILEFEGRPTAVIRHFHVYILFFYQY